MRRGPGAFKQALRQKTWWVSLKEREHLLEMQIRLWLREAGVAWKARVTRSFNAGNLKQIRVEMGNEPTRAEHLRTPEAELP